MNDIIDQLNREFAHQTSEALLAYGLKKFGSKIVLASSLGAEDQVLTHMVASVYKSARIFVLDTGRLHQETYDTMDKTMKKYGISLEVYFPEAAAIEQMVRTQGPNLFYDSVENRKMCCQIRKVEPLKRVLKTAEAWITGIRREQSVTRKEVQLAEWDEAHGILKLNPLANWSNEQVWSYIKEHNIPYNALHDQGYPSIGCAPCTRAIQPGEDLRAGRWWWENPENKECGLHVVDGKLVRKKG